MLNLHDSCVLELIYEQPLSDIIRCPFLAACRRENAVAASSALALFFLPTVSRLSSRRQTGLTFGPGLFKAVWPGPESGFGLDGVFA